MSTYSVIVLTKKPLLVEEVSCAKDQATAHALMKHLRRAHLAYVLERYPGGEGTVWEVKGQNAKLILAPGTPWKVLSAT